VLNRKADRVLAAFLRRIEPLAFTDAPVQPIHLAVTNGVDNIVEDLLQYYEKASLGTIRRDWTSPIESQIKNPGAAGVWSLTGSDRGYSTNNISTGTPLHIAAYTGQKHAAELLLKYGALVDSVDGLCRTPLHLATREGNSEISKLLLRNGANPNARDLNLKTPSMSAFYCCSQDVIRLLRKSGADFSIRDTYGNDSLFYALLAKRPSNLLLLDQDRHALHCVDNFGTPYVQLAFQWDCRALQVFILNADFDLTASTIQRGNVFQIASQVSSAMLKRLLRRIQSSEVLRLVNCRPQDMPTALYAVAAGIPSRNIDLLLAAGADLELEGGPCGTALMGACDAGRLESVKILVRYGAKIEYLNSAGVVVSAIKTAKYHPALVRWLLVSRFTEQQKICEIPDGSSEGKDMKFWSGSKIVKAFMVGLQGKSQLECLRELNQARLKYLGKVYYPVQ
jgi:ankyrin repeat protein